MAKAKKHRRNIFTGIIMAAVLVLISGCSASESFSLASFLSSEKSPVVNEGSVGKGPQMADGAGATGDVVIVGNSGTAEGGGIIQGSFEGEPSTGEAIDPPNTQTDGDKPDATATDKPDATATDKPDATATDKPDATATDKPDATATDKPDATATDKPDATATDKPDATATDKPDAPPSAGKPDKAVDKLDKPDMPVSEAKPSKSDKLIALTFDDGPDQRYTTDILDILKEKGVKATFFVVGQQVSKNPEVLQRIVDEGHAVGNHTYNHKDLSKLNKQQIIEEVKTGDAAIKKAIGYTPAMVRAPYGAVSDTLKGVLKSNNRELVGWNIDTRDWAGTSAANIRKMIKNEAKPGGIILMHSFGGKHIKNTVQALPDVIDDLVKKGYTLVTADQID
ncbi:polysaccharide deacetylase family protein [Paenibacillus sp. PL91]|uniref:polysaccharide deacetylase family protein n=1 Tax=Paenibacillus sp. PL91 TaxID=2729538 RepID=UPI00145FB44D|nr:polysaccharide deacetylase family protein [Paenibacillus sp. PL91]MBC9201570.1 polysaccharide deacetylase family protein [Paenibacillus sp. PL91]